jgi:hypothetical protein
LTAVISFAAERFSSLPSGPLARERSPQITARPLVRWLAAPGLVAAALLAAFGLPYGASNPNAFAHVYTEPSTGLTAHLEIDAIPGNGNRPCDPIDTSATVAVGSTHTVAICFDDYKANDVRSFQIRLTNDDALNFAPDPQGSEEAMNGGTGPDCATVGCLDDNPDANDGDSPAGLKLGSNWDCTGLEFLRPRSEVLPIELVCNAALVSPDMDLSADPGLLATATFRADAAGVDTIGFVPWTSIGMKTDDQKSCGDMPEYLIGCFGATIHKVAAPMPTPTPGPVGGVAELPDMGTAPAAEAGGPGEDSGWWAGNYAALAGVGAAAAVAVAGAWYARRRLLR